MLAAGPVAALRASINSIVTVSLHWPLPFPSFPIVMHVNPLSPVRRVRMLPFFSMRTTAAPFATALGAAERTWAMYSESEICFC